MEDFPKYKIEFDTAYNQFYIGDKDYTSDTGALDFWSQESFNARMAMADDVLGIGTGSYGHIKSTLMVLAKAATDTNFINYDHIVEGSIKVPSGFLQITNCPDNSVELKVKVKPGDYRVRVYSIHLAQADPDLYEGTDSYKIEIWPDTYKLRTVLKMYIAES